MKEFKLSANITVSVYTTVYANNIEEAKELASERNPMSITANGGDDEFDSWMCDELDGEAYNIEED